MLIVTAIVANGRKANPADASVVPGFRCELDVGRRGKRLAEGPVPDELHVHCQPALRR